MVLTLSLVLIEHTGCATQPEKVVRVPQSGCAEYGENKSHDSAFFPVVACVFGWRSRATCVCCPLVC